MILPIVTGIKLLIMKLTTFICAKSLATKPVALQNSASAKFNTQIPAGIINMFAIQCSKPDDTNNATGKIVATALSVSVLPANETQTPIQTIKLQKIPDATHSRNHF